MDYPVIISNGFGRFHLRLAAREVERDGRLAAFITGALAPDRTAKVLATIGIAEIPSIARLLARRDSVPNTNVHSLYFGEPFSQLATRIRGKSKLSNAAADKLHLFSRNLYAASARKVVRRLPPADGRGIYHYRAGFGGKSVDIARQRGWICLCDHTIAHPALLNYLVTHKGTLPPVGQTGTINSNWRSILADINQADHVLTNSNFVEQTFVHQGWHEEKVSVIYLGVDEGTLDLVPQRTRPSGPIKLMFAGSFGPRKGGPILVDALSELNDIDWHLDVCGPIEAACRASFNTLLEDPRVQYLGNLSSRNLAARMAQTEIFIFPSLAEGSARVVFEALAAGCYVVTTPNAGSIVEDGVHGALIPPANSSAISEAIRSAAQDREHIAMVGRANSTLIRKRYRQESYGRQLVALYDKLIAEPQKRD